MSIQKKKYKKTKKDDSNIEYSAEEAEALGIQLENFVDEEVEEVEELEDLEIENKKTEVVAEPTGKKKRGKKVDPDKIQFYVDPKEFDTQILKYYETGILSNELAEMVSKIAHKLSFANNFINYSYREEMVGDGIIRMFKALMSKKYSHDKGTNPFSYFTRIAFNAFRNRIKKEKHMHETHEKYRDEFIMFSENYNNLVKNNKTKGYTKDS
jgi:hypothetical protein